MAQRGFLTETWSDPWFQSLSSEQSLIFIYLWTNEHCNQAGLYQITPATISFEIKIPLTKVLELLKSLEPKVEWFPEENIIWVKNFLKHQAKSPKFLVAVGHCLDKFYCNGKASLVEKFVEYNSKYMKSIGYRYPTDGVSIHTNTNTISNTKAISTGKGVVKGKGGSRPDKYVEGKYGHMVRR